MNGQRYFLVGFLALALLLINVVSLPAADQNNFGATMGNARIAQLFGDGQSISGLNFTADQKAKIKSILEGNKTQIQKAVRDMVQGGLDMINGAPNAANELANAQLQAENLAKLIFEQLKSVLTPDQLAKVQESQQLGTQYLQKLLEMLNDRIGG
jgi:Spy/CpxP family protein refolding chaperone